MGRIIFVNKAHPLAPYYFHSLVQHYSDGIRLFELKYIISKLIGGSVGYILTNSRKMVLPEDDVINGSRVYCILDNFTCNRLLMAREFIPSAMNNSNRDYYPEYLAEEDFYADLPDLMHN